jgi:quercetin dioxygenase-like cupin family protein
MKTSILAGFGVALALSATVNAQPSAVHKTTLQTDPFPGAGNHSVLVHTDVDAGGLVGRHTHPGLELAFIDKGEALVRIDGRPELHLSAGASFDVPPKTPHSVQNVGQGVLTIVSTYVVDPAEPIASPVK